MLHLLIEIEILKIVIQEWTGRHPPHPPKNRVYLGKTGGMWGGHPPGVIIPPEWGSVTKVAKFQGVELWQIY